MKYYRIKCEVYKAAGKGWERMAGELPLSTAHGGGKEYGGKMVRPVFFTFCEDSQEYQLQWSFLEQWVDDHLVSPHPVPSLVAQKLLMGGLVMEVHLLPATAGGEMMVEGQMTSPARYPRVTSGHYRGVIVGGLHADDLILPVRGQSEQVFGKAGEILKVEQMGFGDIVRQRDYLKRIMDIVYGNQCCQDFDDIRSQFYASPKQASGYPTVAGAETQHGGILADFNAVKGGVEIIPLDNDWQRAAHVYSDEALISHRTDAEKRTPKFGRGKSLSDHQQEMIYMSGTVAIRSERSTVAGDVPVWTETTLENTQYLIGLREEREKLPEHSGKLELLRMYLKYKEDMKTVKEDTGKLCSDVPIVYLYADVRREELLVEIEGITYL